MLLPFSRAFIVLTPAYFFKRALFHLGKAHDFFSHPPYLVPAFIKEGNRDVNSPGHIAKHVIWSTSNILVSK